SEVVFNEAVSGLSRGRPVQYNGITVGDVSTLRLDPQDPRRVLARVRLSGDTPVKEDTQAKLTLAGVTGNAFIQLSGGTPQSPELKGKDGKLPIIIASPSPISRLLNDSSDLVTNINLLLHNANQMFSERNVEHLSNTLANLDQTTGAFASKKGGIADTLAQLAEVGRQANATLAETQALMRNANGLLGTQGKQAIGSAEQAMQSLAETSATLNRLLQDNRQAIDDGAQGLNQVAPAIRELRETLNSLKGISRRLEADPSGYLLGRDNNKEFQP
ncbi:MAG: MlaD family protein, partial [Pseudomonas farsensis]|uniref:MlaD family protein n=1 Tax=Pseudomonas farsensis TaxID=2745492 RepID=UPI003C7D1EA6